MKYNGLLPTSSLFRYTAETSNLV